MKFIFRNIGLFCLFISTFLSENAHSQVITNVVTKEINKTYTISSKTKITIDAEKADIQISTSKDNEFKLNLKLISKNPDINKAKEQLTYLHYILKETRQEITIRNFILLTNNKEISGSIKAVYTLEIPSNVTVIIKNTLGDINITGINGTYTFDIKYGNLAIKESKGVFNITQFIGDLFVYNSDLSCELNSENASNNFKKIKGSFNIKSNMGSLNFELNKLVSDLNINSVGTEINISNILCHEFNWDINSVNGSLYINECNIKDRRSILNDNRDENLSKTVFKYKCESITNTIIINNKYSNIFIN